MNKKTLTLAEFQQWKDNQIDKYESAHFCIGDGYEDSADSDYECGCCEGYYRAMRHVEEFLKERIEDDEDKEDGD